MKDDLITLLKSTIDRPQFVLEWSIPVLVVVLTRIQCIVSGRVSKGPVSVKIGYPMFKYQKMIRESSY